MAVIGMRAQSASPEKVLICSYKKNSLKGAAVRIGRTCDIFQFGQKKVSVFQAEVITDFVGNRDERFMDIHSGRFETARPHGGIEAVKTLAASDIEKACHPFREKRGDKTVSLIKLEAGKKFFPMYGVFMVVRVSHK